ncbi:MAG: hypothetical protein GWP19_04235 [Planctomycetia bacterium]|nr:hypothetical protein [Planctomycetia bacterium]
MNNNLNESYITLKNVDYAPDTPELQINDSILFWDSIETADHYKIYCNGQQIASSDQTYYEIISQKQYSEYQVLTVDKNGYESFLSQPLPFNESSNIITLKPDNSDIVAENSGFTGQGYLELSKNNNREVVFSFEISDSGKYAIDFRYNNGHGPINTNNKCTVRSAFLDNDYIGAVVLPQRGDLNWTDWGYSNAIQIGITPGYHNITLKFLNHNQNMNIKTNSANLDIMRLTALDQN